ncbi:MAG: DUF4037 domain-containing protein [Rhizobacter sp.]
MPSFMPGLELSRLFYEEAVHPVLRRKWPGLKHSAALLGTGSDVLGFDTSQSMDHHWGPRLTLFLDAADMVPLAAQIHETLRHELPTHVAGVPTHFGPPDAIGVRLLQATPTGPVDHMVGIGTIEGFWRANLGLRPDWPLTLQDWLLTPQQLLLSVVRGAVFHDGLGRLEALRRTAHWYPHDLWLYLLAAQWTRVSQEEAFLGRCGDVGDELGSRLVAARLVRDLMRLCFLMERCYAPYTKWLGTAFARLRCGPALLPVFEQVLHAGSWPEREGRMTQAYAIVADMHNALGLTPALAATVSPFHDRPYLVIHGDRFADALHTAITDPAVKALPRGLGSVDQFIDSTDVLRPGASRTRALLGVYAGE